MRKAIRYFSMLLLMVTILFTNVSANQPDMPAELPTEWEIQHNSNVQYTALLNSFKGSSGIIEYPEYYGGAYLNSSGLLVVTVTDMSPYIISSIIEATSNEDIIVETVDYSYNSLLDLQEEILDYAINGQNQAVKDKIEVISVCDDTNDLVVSITDNDTNVISAVMSEISLGYPLSRRAQLPVRFEVEAPASLPTDAVSKPQEGNQNSPYDSKATLYAGDEVTISNRGSIGYPRRKLVDGSYVYGFVTAAHLIIDDGTPHTYMVKHGNKTIGYTVRYQDSFGLDAAFIAVDQTAASLPEKVNAYYESEGYSTKITIATDSTMSLAVGSTIWKDGVVTNCTTGTVKSVNATVTPKGSQNTLTNLIQATRMSDNGDSGGIAFGLGTKAYPVGIVVGGEDGLFSKNTYFEKASVIDEAFDLEEY